MAGVEIPDREIGGSVERVRAALVAAGHPDTIVEFSAGTGTAGDAATAVGCTVGQIAKSIVFRCDARPMVVITSGANRVDPARVEAMLATKLGRAAPEWIRQTTGSLSAVLLRLAISRRQLS
jgi:prolyl-tRNA editing enzyme YbaK/EbsC (Cys-tRNA(Pro) deacylase)